MRERLIAWILSIVLSAGSGGLSDLPDKEDTAQMEIFKSAYALQTPDFPQQAPYPKDDGVSYDANAWSSWSQQFSDRREAALAYDGKLDHYLQTILPALLTPQQDNVNAVCSPVNVWFALAMATEAAAGDTQKELLDLLGVSSVEELRAIAVKLWAANYSDDGATTCRLGSSLWMNRDIRFKEATLQTLAKEYYAASFSGSMVDPAFSRAFKDWLDEMTGGLLKDNIEQLENFKPDTVLAIATTVYFSAKWDNQFSESRTFKETFHGTKKDADVDFMHNSITASYYSEDRFGAVQLPFTQAGSMWLILPDKGTTPEDLIHSGEALSFLGKSFEERQSKSLSIDLAVPKFDLTASQDLKETLLSLGIERMFTGAADFSNLTDDCDVHVSTATHDARVKIDEEGCEAAAFTVLMLEKSAMMPGERMEFRLDRPFIFVVTGLDELPLFMGLVNQVE